MRTRPKTLNSTRFSAPLVLIGALFGIFLTFKFWNAGLQDRFLLYYNDHMEHIPAGFPALRTVYRLFSILCFSFSYGCFYRLIREFAVRNWSIEKYKKTENASQKEELANSIGQTVKHTRNLYFMHIFLFAYGVATLLGIRDETFYSMSEGFVKLPILNIPIEVNAFFFLMPIFMIGFSIYLQIYIGYLTTLLFKHQAISPRDKDKPYPWIGVMVVKQEGVYRAWLWFVFGLVSWWFAPIMIFLYWHHLLFLRSSLYNWLILDLNDVIASQPIGFIALFSAIVTMITIGVRRRIIHEILVQNDDIRNYTLPWPGLFRHWTLISSVLLFFMAIPVVFQWDFFDAIKLPVRPANLAHSCLSLPAEEGKGKGVAGANLVGVNLIEANLKGAYLQDADMTKAILEGANLIKANLSGAQLKQAEMMGVDLWAAHLEGAQLQSAHLEGANLWDARLDAACLGMEKEALENALKKMKFDICEACVFPNPCKNLKDVTYFEGCDELPVTHLDGAQLGHASLRRATVGCTSFRAANLYRTVFENNRFKRYHYDMHFVKYPYDFLPDFEGAIYSRPTPQSIGDPEEPFESMYRRIKNWIDNGAGTDDCVWNFKFKKEGKEEIISNDAIVLWSSMDNEYEFSCLMPTAILEVQFKKLEPGVSWKDERIKQLKEIMQNDPERWKRQLEMSKPWMEFDKK